MPKLLIGDVRGPQGETGVGIKEIVLKEGSSTGNTYTIELTNGQTFDIVAPAGPQGIQGIKGEQGTTDYNLLENVPESFTPKPHEHDERYPKIKELEKISTILQSNTGIKFDPDLLYLNYEGIKKVGYCYLDELADGIYECIQETTTTVNDSACFKNISNKNNSDRLDNLSILVFEKVSDGESFYYYKKYADGTLEVFGVTNMNGATFKEIALKVPFFDNQYIALTTYVTLGQKHNIISVSATKTKEKVGFYCNDNTSSFGYYLIGKWK